MEKLVLLGLLDPGGEDNVYEELLAKINKNKFSANILTVTVVHALSKPKCTNVFFKRNA